ncbi:hypothetical protein ACTXT7_015444 [Hymenolepis weldensis]
MILDGDVYDRFREVLSKTSETELEICRHHQDPFRTLLEESAKINRAQAWENFIKESPILSEDVEFQFEPRDGDTNWKQKLENFTGYKEEVQRRVICVKAKMLVVRLVSIPVQFILFQLPEN